jgi:hypothetical protein
MEVAATRSSTKASRPVGVPILEEPGLSVAEESSLD